MPVEHLRFRRGRRKIKALGLPNWTPGMRKTVEVLEVRVHMGEPCAIVFERKTQMTLYMLDADLAGVGAGQHREIVYTEEADLDGKYFWQFANNQGATLLPETV